LIELTVHPSFKVDSVPVLKEAPTKHLHVVTDLKPSTSSSCVRKADHAVLSSTSGICKQAVSKSHDHHVVPVKQEILQDFLLNVDQGTFGIPCGSKVCCSSPGMSHVSWPMEKSA